MTARDQARPAPATVTRFSEGAIQPEHRRATETRKRTSKPEVRRIDPAVMKYALDLADGDASRLVLHPEDGTVTVTNHHGRKETPR